jgi:hypothetical protein
VAVALRGLSSAVLDGSSSTTSLSTSGLALPAGTATGDRVLILYSSSPGATTPTTPTGWTLIGTTSVGTGTQANGTGPRRVTAWYRDYDGSWSMPTVVLPSSARPEVAIQVLALSKAASEVWDAPATSTGSQSTTTSSWSVAGGSLAMPTGAFVVAFTAMSDLRTATSEGLTASGVTFANLTERADNTGSGVGDDISQQVYTAEVTTGATAAPTLTLTANASTDGGARFISQTVSPGDITITGAAAVLGLVAPAGLAAFDTTVAGATAVLGLLAPAGSGTADADVAGATALLGQLADGGAVSFVGDITIQGSAAVLGLLAPAGAALSETIIAGATAVLGLISAGGQATVGVDVAGQTALFGLLAPAGFAEGDATVAGATAVLGLAAPGGRGFVGYPVGVWDGLQWRPVTVRVFTETGWRDDVPVTVIPS